MGVPSDGAVLILKGKKPGEPHVITVNCPDKHGLGCDICRIILDFGLYITNGVTFYLNDHPSYSAASPVYLLKFFYLDRKGLLHGNHVTQVLCELNLTIQKVKVMTTPDGRVLDLFFITDNMELLHTKERQDDMYKQLNAVLGESCISYELKLAGPEYECHHGISSLSLAVAEELFRFELSDKETRSQALSPDMTKLKKENVVVENSLSPAHTLIQLHCVDHKGLFYDVLKTLKDCNVKIAYGRFSSNSNGYRDLDLFIQQKDGKKIVHPDKQNRFCSHLKVEMLHPLCVIISNRGPDTELLVANSVEFSGKERRREAPPVYDVTLSLKTLGICIFSAEIGRHSSPDREWEVYRFLLDENSRFKLSSIVARNQIVDKVRRMLMGW
ncbi:hypothetical protein CRYUN_Cryun02cG0191600 [Craigia yunnanensis]